MVPRVLKSIFGRKINNSNVRPKIDPGRSEIDLVKKSKAQFFDQNWPNVQRGLKLIFGRKMENSISRSKMDPGGQKN